MKTTKTSGKKKTIKRKVAGKKVKKTKSKPVKKVIKKTKKVKAVKKVKTAKAVAKKAATPKPKKEKVIKAPKVEKVVKEIKKPISKSVILKQPKITVEEKKSIINNEIEKVRKGKIKIKTDERYIFKVLDVLKKTWVIEKDKSEHFINDYDFTSVFKSEYKEPTNEIVGTYARIPLKYFKLNGDVLSTTIFQDLSMLPVFPGDSKWKEWKEGKRQLNKISYDIKIKLGNGIETNEKNIKKVLNIN